MFRFILVAPFSLHGLITWGTERVEMSCHHPKNVDDRTSTDTVREVLEETEIPPASLILELTGELVGKAAGILLWPAQ
jgi:hypothetical protein